MLDSWDIRFWEYDFYAPHYLWLIVLVPIVLWLLIRRENRKKGNWKFTGKHQDLNKLSDPRISQLRIVLIVGYCLVITLLVLALAKPFKWISSENREENYKYGIDIILAMDVSLSMLAMDFNPNRLEASKAVAKDFLDGRVGDRVGLVVYAGEAYTACPATLDYTILKQHIDLIGNENIEAGTAIGTGLGTAVARLRNEGMSSKVIILLTDGSNNAGEIDPLTAATLAHEKNICVYTIGVGSNGTAPTPVMTPFGIRFEEMPVEIDEKTLKQIAKISNGKYFRATDESSLKSIYKEIDKLEKRKIIDKRFQASPPSTPKAFLNWALMILLFSLLINGYFFRQYE